MHALSARLILTLSRSYSVLLQCEHVKQLKAGEPCSVCTHEHMSSLEIFLPKAAVPDCFLEQTHQADNPEAAARDDDRVSIASLSVYNHCQ